MPAIELTTVTKRRDPVTVLDGVSLEVACGELVAVLGPNGAGKSTLFEVLLGLTRPDGGRVRVMGAQPGSPGAVVQIGAMLQNAGLRDNITGRELLRLVGRSYPRSLGVDAVLDRVGLAGRGRRIVSKLSGGERQRLLLAAAVIGSPGLLLLDEPTAGMDPEAKRRFWREARAAVAEGTTVFFATHDIAETEDVANRVVVLGEGRILADATPGELKRQAAGNLEHAYFSLTEPLDPAGRVVDLDGRRREGGAA